MDKIGNLKREQAVFKSRVVFSIVIMLLVAFILIYRLFHLQIIQHDFYVEEALGNQMQNLPITPIRGDILDRNGKIIATNQFSYRLTITPEKVSNLNDTLVELEINEYIDDEDIKRFNDNLNRYKKFQNIPIKFNLSESSASSFLVSNQIPGVEVEPYFHRVYPYGISSSHLIGYVSSMSKEEKNIYDKKKLCGHYFYRKNWH